ncbi:MAG: ferredoxin [Gemmatimonadales bacterium]
MSDAAAGAAAEAEADPTVERRVGELTVTIDRLLCVGFGDCIEEAPEAFEFDDEGIAVLTNPERVECDRLLRACELCPVDAITVTDANGRRLVPEAPED